MELMHSKNIRISCSIPLEKNCNDIYFVRSITFDTTVEFEQFISSLTSQLIPDNQCTKFEKSTNFNSGTCTQITSSLSEVICNADYHNKSLNNRFDKFFNIDYNVVALGSSNIPFNNDAQSSSSKKNSKEKFFALNIFSVKDSVTIQT